MEKPIGIALLVAGAAVVGGSGWWYMQRGHEETDNAYVRAEVTVVSPRIAGYVSSLLVGDNEAVTAGQTLMRIDARDYRARATAATAALTAAEAALRGLELQIEAQAAAMSEAEAAMEAANADRVYAAKDLQRISNLVSNDAASRKSYDAALAAEAKTKAALKQAQAKREMTEQKTALLKANRVQQTALVEQARAQLELARIDLDNTEVKAPTAGVIGNRAVHEGQLVTPGARLLSVVPLHSVWIEANFKETQIARFRIGQKASIRIDAFPGTRIEGRVSGFSPAAGSEFSLLPPQNATGNFTKIVQRIPVRIELPPDAPLIGKLRPGMSAVVDIDALQAPSKGGAQ